MSYAAVSAYTKWHSPSPSNLFTFARCAITKISLTFLMFVSSMEVVSDFFSYCFFPSYLPKKERALRWFLGSLLPELSTFWGNIVAVQLILASPALSNIPYCFVIQYHCVSGEPGVRSSVPTMHVMNEGHKLVPAHIPYVASHSPAESLLWPLYFAGHVHLSTKDYAMTDNQYHQNGHLFGKMQGKLHAIWTLEICKNNIGRAPNFGFRSLWLFYLCAVPVENP